MSKLEAGTYRGRCTGPRDVKFGKSQQGNLQIGLLFEITAGDMKGLRAPWYGSLASKESYDFVRRTLMTCGWDGKSWTILDGLTKNCVRLVFEEEGRFVRLKYINDDTGIVFKDELGGDELVAELRMLDAALQAPLPRSDNGAREPVGGDEPSVAMGEDIPY